MSQAILLLYVVAVETGRFTIDYVPSLYRKEVARLLDIEI